MVNSCSRRRRLRVLRLGLLYVLSPFPLLLPPDPTRADAEIYNEKIYDLLESPFPQPPSSASSQTSSVFHAGLGLLGVGGIKAKLNKSFQTVKRTALSLKHDTNAGNKYVAGMREIRVHSAAVRPFLSSSSRLAEAKAVHRKLEQSSIRARRTVASSPPSPTALPPARTPSSRSRSFESSREPVRRTLLRPRRAGSVSSIWRGVRGSSTRELQVRRASFLHVGGS